jgi:hypothetical protein
MKIMETHIVSYDLYTSLTLSVCSKNALRFTLLWLMSPWLRFSSSGCIFCFALFDIQLVCSLDCIIRKTTNPYVFQPPILSTIVPVTKGLFKRLGFRRKLLLFWVMLSIAFVSLWPTITNAMTGYVPLNDAMVLLKGQNASVYADYSNISATSNLAFQFVMYYEVKPYEFPTNSSPIFFKDGPNTTLWTNMYQGNNIWNH